MKRPTYDYNRAYELLPRFILTCAILALVVTARFLRNVLVLLRFAENGREKASLIVRLPMDSGPRISRPLQSKGTHFAIDLSSMCGNRRFLADVLGDKFDESANRSRWVQR